MKTKTSSNHIGSSTDLLPRLTRTGKNALLKFESFKRRATLGLLNPLLSPILWKKSQKQVQALGSLSIFLKISEFPTNMLRLMRSLPQCKLLAIVLNDFAKKYPMIKVLKIPGDQCIEGYPDQLMPTILVYGPNEFRSQIVGLAELGGNSTRVPGTNRLQRGDQSSWRRLDLERYAEKIGALTKSDLRVSRDGEDEDDIGIEKKQMRRGTVADNDDEDWDWSRLE